MPWILLSLAVLIICVLTATGFLGLFWWIFDLASHFRFQYFILLILFTIILIFTDQRVVAGVAFTFGIVNLAFIIPLYIRPRKIQTEQIVFRLLLANVYQPNQSYDRVLELVKSHSPDFILFIEINQVWLNALEGLHNSYPFSIELGRDDNYGMVLFSRFKSRKASIHHFGNAGLPSIIAEYDFNGESFTIIGSHPPPPKGAENSKLRNQQLSEIANYAIAKEGTIMLIGDLNITPWSPFFHRLLRDGGLINSAIGFGYQPTWPTKIPFLQLPIDHCLVSPEVVVVQKRIGPDIGSDHYPVIVDFSFN